MDTSPNKLSMRRRPLLAGMAAMFVLAGARTSHGAEPAISKQPLKIIVGYSAGTSPDVAARTLAPLIAASWPAGVVVDNRPGAGGAIAVAAVGTAPADGATLLLASAGEIAIAPNLSVKMPFDPAGLIPLCQVVTGELVLVAGSQTGAPNFVELVRNRAGKPAIMIGTLGPGTPHHLVAAMMAEALKKPVEMVHYRNPGDMLTDLNSGQLDGGFVSAAIALTWTQGGKVRVLATSAPERAALFPDAPTLRELNLGSAEAVVWIGFFAPPGTPASLVRQMSLSIATAAKAPDFVAKMQGIGFQVKTIANDDFAKVVAADRVRYEKVTTKIGLKTG